MGKAWSKETKDTIDVHVHRKTFNVAVIGQSGVGKSSFINTFRNVKRGEESFAEEDVVETTTKPSPYENSEYPNLVLWDIPGVGTQAFPKQEYVRKINFKIYDFFLILSSQRFSENDLWLAQTIKKIGKEFFYVRTQIDIDIHKRNDLGEREVVEKVRNDCVQKLAQDNFSNADDLVFLINNKDPHAYDFQKLITALVQTLSKTFMLL